MSPTRPRSAARLGRYPVSLRIVTGSAEADRLDRWASVLGGRSAALRAGLAALAERDAAEAEVDRLRAERDAALAERDRLCAVIAEAAADLPLHPEGAFLTPPEADAEAVRQALLVAAFGPGVLPAPAADAVTLSGPEVRALREALAESDLSAGRFEGLAKRAMLKIGGGEA
jgi:hypothetical protein